MTVAVAVVLAVMVARVAFSTHRMCTGNTRRRRWGRGGRGHRPRRLVRLAPVEPFSFSPVLSFSLFASLAFPAAFLHRLLSSPVPLPVHNCVTPRATQLRGRSTNGGHRNPRDKPRRYNAPRYAAIPGLGLPFHRERRDLSVRREVSISRSLVRMPFPRHCRAVAATQYSRTSVRCTR